LDHKVHKVYKDQSDHKVKWAQEDYKEILVLLGQLDHKVYKVYREILDHKVFKDQQEDQPVLMDQLV
jgi:hypothetical protein